MNEKLKQYYITKSEPNQGCLLALRHIILRLSNDMDEALKWGLPCFTYQKRIICFLNIEKKSQQPYILFVNGDQMSHPLLEKGDRKQMKILRIDAHKDLPLALITSLVNEAMSLSSGNMKSR